MNKTNWARMCLALLLLIFSFNVSAQKGTIKYFV